MRSENVSIQYNMQLLNVCPNILSSAVFRKLLDRRSALLPCIAAIFYLNRYRTGYTGTWVPENSETCAIREDVSFLVE